MSTLKATNLQHASSSVVNATLNSDGTMVGMRPPINAQTGTTYTLVIGDDGKMVTCANASAITLTVPPNADVAFPTGAMVDVVQTGAGQVTIAAGSGVTIRSQGAALKLSAQYAAAQLRKIGSDEWLLVGSITS